MSRSLPRMAAVQGCCLGRKGGSPACEEGVPTGATTRHSGAAGKQDLGAHRVGAPLGCGHSGVGRRSNCYLFFLREQWRAQCAQATLIGSIST